MRKAVLIVLISTIILAAAGVERMEWKEAITEELPYDVCLPAVSRCSARSLSQAVLSTYGISCPGLQVLGTSCRKR